MTISKTTPSDHLKQIRHWSFTRMLYSPFLLLLKLFSEDYSASLSRPKNPRPHSVNQKKAKELFHRKQDSDEATTEPDSSDEEIVATVQAARTHPTTGGLRLRQYSPPIKNSVEPMEPEDVPKDCPSKVSLAQNAFAIWENPLADDAANTAATKATTEEEINPDAFWAELEERYKI